MWVIAAVPALTALLVLVADVACLWQARLQLETAASAGALAGARVWGEGAQDGQDRAEAEQAAAAFAQSNLVVKTPLDSQGIQVQTGFVDAEGRFHVQTGDALPPEAADAVPACRVQASVQVDSFWKGWAGPYTLHAASTAAHDAGNTRLVRIREVQ